MTTRDRPGTSSPESDGNSCKPVSVRKDTSTRASAANGFSTTSHCDTPRTVVPAAKYQSAPAVLAHGTAATASLVSSPAETTTSGENGSTTSDPFGSKERWNVRTESPGTVRRRDTGPEPPSGWTVTSVSA